MKKFCLCLDLDGFYVNNKFVVREIGWYAPLLNNHEAFGVQHFTHDYTWDMLSKKDQRTVAYVKRCVMGMTFRPSPAEFLLRHLYLTGARSCACLCGTLVETFQNA